MNTKQLRQKILDLAIRGKLVPQDPNDEPASVLLERIRAEKERLVMSGALKRNKNNFNAISEEDSEKYGMLPDGWILCRLHNIAKIGTGATPLTSDSSYYNGGTVPWVTSAETNKSSIDKPTSYITHKALTETNCSLYPIGTLVVAMYGEGKTRGQISELMIEAATNQACAAISQITKNSYETSYIKACFEKNYDDIRNQAKGAQQPNLNLTIISNFVVPLPPIAEQHRIIAAIDSAFAIIDEIERNKTDLQAAITAAKQKILSLAIQGKLVPQDTTDELAVEFLGRIFNNDVIEVEDIPFELPTNWAWSKFGSVCEIARGGSPRPISDFITTSDDGVNWIKIGDTEQGGKYIYETAEKIKSEGMARSRFVHSGDFLLTNSMSFGRPYILKTDGCIHDGWLVIGNVEKVFIPDYLYHVLSSNWAYQSLSMVAVGSTVKNLKTDTVKKMILPIPPLAEQHRIVTAINSAFEQLDNMVEILS